MKLTGEEARRIVYRDSDDWEFVEDCIVDNTRWSVLKDAIHKHIPTGKFYEFNFSVGATEMQDESPYEYDDEVEIYEVEQREVTTKQWVAV